MQAQVNSIGRMARVPDDKVQCAASCTTDREPAIRPLRSGGIFLTYHCTSECRHCLYDCSPRRPDDWMTLDMARRVFAALAKEPQLGPVHISGGEPGMRPDLLEDVIRLALASGVQVSYVQTNGFWCTDPSATRRILERLKDAGLRGLYVSVSMFHNEQIPFRNSRTCVEAARDVFGPANVTLWSPGDVDLYGLLCRMPDDGTHSFEEFRRWSREAGVEDELTAALDDLVPRGRILRTMPGLFQPRPAAAFEGETCITELTSTESSGTTYHYHIDYCGDLVMGCCVGLSPATVDDLHPRITADSHPVFHRLCTAGPSGLAGRAAAESGYRSRPEGYLSKCDLCFDVRKRLLVVGGFPELRPASVYDE